VPTTDQLTKWLGEASFADVEVIWRPDVALGVACVTATLPAGKAAGRVADREEVA
jgi:hypothetical protein